jgi:hypothetical protein
MRRLGALAVLALVVAGGCKQSGTGVYLGFLDIYTEPTLDGGLVTDRTYSFPTACPNFPVTQQFYIANPTLTSVTISSVSLSSTTAFSLAAPVIGNNTIVQPGTNITQTVQFDPPGSGPQPTSTLTVATLDGQLPDGGGPATYTVTLSGMGQNGPADATIGTSCNSSSPCNSLGFGLVAVGFPSDLSLTVSNQGCPPLTLATSFSGPDGGTSPYSLVSPAPGNVYYNNPVTLTVRYSPTVPNVADIWDLVLTTNDPNTPVTKINLTGLSTQSKVEFTAPSPILCPSPTQIGVNGQANVGVPLDVPYGIINNGTIPVQVATPYIDGGYIDGGVGFSVANAWTNPITLDGGETATFDVVFTSPGAGNYIGTVVVPVIGGALTSCQMNTRSVGGICSPDGGLPVQTIVLPPPPNPNDLLCGSTMGEVILTNCGSSPIDLCGIDAGFDPDSGAPLNGYYGLDAGPYGELAPGDSFTILISFTDPASLNNPWAWTYNICTDAPGYEVTDAGGGGYQLTIQVPTNPVPSVNPPVPPVVISGLDDAGVNPVFGQQMHLVADIDAGLGAFYDFVWVAPAVLATEVNVCADGGVGLWFVDAGGAPQILPDGGTSPNIGGEAFVTPTKYWVPGDTHTPVCKICTFAFEHGVDAGNCNFNNGFNPTDLHCFGGKDGIGVITGP